MINTQSIRHLSINRSESGYGFTLSRLVNHSKDADLSSQKQKVDKYNFYMFIINLNSKKKV